MLALIALPPWRYTVVTDVDGPDYGFIFRREARAYSPLTHPPEYHRLVWRGVERTCEHIDDSPELDTLRLGLSITGVIVFLLCANCLLVSGHSDSWGAWAALGVVAVLGWAIADYLLVTVRPRVEDAMITMRLDPYLDEILALPIRLFK